MQRIGCIDILRAIGILLMIIGHIGSGQILDKWIHAFHMPMFFIISGFFSKQCLIFDIIKKRLKTILIPYFIIGLFHILIYLLFNDFNIEYIISLLYEPCGNEIPIAGALWFLPAIFFSEVLFSSINNNIKNQYFRDFSIITLSISGIIFSTFLTFRLPYSLDAGLVGVGLFRIGELIKNNYKIFEKFNFKFFIISFFIFSILSMLNGKVNMKSGIYANWFLFYINSTGMTMSLWIFAKYVHSRLSANNMFYYIKNYICNIGQNSIVYLCFNQLSILLSIQIIMPIINRLESNFGILLLRQVLIFLTTMIFLSLIQKITLETKLKVIFGK